MLPRVHAILRRLRVHEDGRDYEDLVQEGMVAALGAAASYDPRHDTTFTTWAQTKAQGAIVDYLRRQDRTRGRDGDRRARVIPLEAAPSATVAARRAGGGDVVPLHEVVPDPRAEHDLQEVLEAMHEHERDELVDAVYRLPDNQTFVIACAFWQGMTGKDIARCLGVSEGRVSQLRTEAFARLREDPRVHAFAESHFGRMARLAA
jgi:RNA polymerase sigma factor FliA